MYIFFKEDTKDIIFNIPNRYSKVRNKILKSYNQKPEIKTYFTLRCENFICFCKV